MTLIQSAAPTSFGTDERQIILNDYYGQLLVDPETAKVDRLTWAWDNRDGILYSKRYVTNFGEDAVALGLSPEFAREIWRGRSKYTYEWAEQVDWHITGSRVNTSPASFARAGHATMLISNDPAIQNIVDIYIIPHLP